MAASKSKPVLLALLGLLSCSRNYAAYTCTSSAQCFFEGQQGRCEPGGVCSFGDGSCPSGFRYAAFAGNPQSNTCVPPPCGGLGQACCTGGASACNAGTLQCESGICATRPCVTDTASGWRHTCALRRDGTVWCWGGNARGQLGNPAITAPLATSPVQVVMLGDVVEVAAGDEHTCARTATNTLLCWGNNALGQLGAPSTTLASAATPQPVKMEDGSPLEAVAVKSGAAHSCALRTNGTVVCWGKSAQGQLGRALSEPSGLPAEVPGLGDVEELALGSEHSCARRKADVVCWGRNDEGQLGIGQGGPAMQPSPQPVRGLTGVQRIFSDGTHHTCALSDNTLSCWGRNESYQLGNSTSRTAWEPVVAMTMQVGSIVDVATSDGATCAANQDGKVYCWGRRLYGEVAQPGSPLGNELAPVLVQNVSGAISLSGGETHFCARQRSGQVSCWGNNQRGQLGNGQATGRPTPTPINVQDLSRISAGSRHACGVTQTNRIFCWGTNDAGQLGDGTRIDRPTPVLVKKLEPGGEETLIAGIHVAAGEDHTCATTLGDQAVYCWGDNGRKQLGVDDVPSSTYARLVPGVPPSGYIQWLSAGAGFTCALANSQTLICWGDNSAGQLGLGASHPRVPDANLARRAVSGVARYVSSGRAHTCGSDPNLYAVCWGDNSSGQLGVAGLTDSPTPIRPGQLYLGSTGIIDAGWNHTCAVNSLNEGFCWGDNASGQLGDGTRTRRTTPSRVMLPAAPIFFRGGHTHTCVWLYDRRLLCAGSAEWDALGIGAETSDRTVLRFIEPKLTSFALYDIFVGDETTYFLRDSARPELSVWGRNVFGSLGDGTRQQVDTPVVVPLTCP